MGAWPWAGTSTTGHDTGGGYPIPTNLVLAPGTSNVDELIRGIERGIDRAASDGCDRQWDQMLLLRLVPAEEIAEPG